MSDDIDACPACDADLLYERNGQTYTRLVGVEVRGVYDGILYWMCPSCEHRWHRWSYEDQPRLHAAAEPYVSR